MSHRHIPNAPPPQEYLRFLTYKGVEERYGVDLLTEDFHIHFGDADGLQDRIEHELSTIEKAGFSGYFLIVQDILRFCREAGIPTGPGRGSICGSAVAYATRITDVDPLRFDIPFERFLHLERIAQPDIDLDICQVRRDEVIDYLRRTYGEDNLAQIITFTPMAAKGVVRDVCRVLHVDSILRGINYNQTGEELAAMIPDGQGADQVFLEDFMESPEGESFKERISKLKVPYNGQDISVLDTCLVLEGIRRHSSSHAAGVVIASQPLAELVPLYRKNQNSEVQIQYDMRDAESVGLLKLDVLGLRTVSVIGEAERIVRRSDPTFDIKNIPLDDEATYSLLSSGDTSAVFQLEGDGITAACTGMRPDRFDDIIALIALYRPGPMEQLGSYFRRKHGEEDIEYAHRDLKPILERSYGLIVYQEQVMGITRVMGGYSAGEADMFRKAIGKKLVPLIRAEIDKFIIRAIERGYPETCVRAIGEQIFDFGRYGFNLGHATGYAFITYWTAYLKANHPAEFFTACLNSQVGVLDKISALLRDCAKRDIRVLPPDINESGEFFTLTPSGIRFGIGGIKGLGENATKDILEERDSYEKNAYTTKRVTKIKQDGTADGKEYKANQKVTTRVANEPRPYDDLYDFCRRLPSVTVTAKEALVLAGAFGTDSLFRRNMVADIKRVNDLAKKGRKWEPDEDIQIMTELELLKKERDVIGFYVTKHPLEHFEADLLRYDAIYNGTFDGLPGICTIGGLVSAIRTHNTAKGEMAWVTLENGIVGMKDLTVFASIWGDVAQEIKTGAVVVANVVKDYHPKFGWGLKVTTIRQVEKGATFAKRIRLIKENPSYGDLLFVDGLTESGHGAEVELCVSDPCGRWCLMALPTRIPATGAAIGDLEKSGWRVHIDSSELKSLEVSGKVLHKSESPYAGIDRTPIWEVPKIDLAIQTLNGRVIAEYK